jgi:hypothetical protein
MFTEFFAEGVVMKASEETQVIDSNLAFARGKELLGTKASGAEANIAALKTYNEGEPDQVEQVEIGSETEHLNLNTNADGEFGDHISVDTRDPETGEPKKEIVAYLSDVELDNSSIVKDPETGEIKVNTVNRLDSNDASRALSAAQGKELNDAKAPLESPNFTGEPTKDDSPILSESDVVDNLESEETGLPLSAAQGKILRLTTTKNFSILTSHADEVDGVGRSLLDVFGVTTIADAMTEIRRRCNNNAEIDPSGIPDFTGIMPGDYLDGINLSAIPAHGGGTAGQAWNDTYKNNRIVVSGFNTFKGAGDTENAKNHLLFTFRNVALQHRVNPANDNAGGYAASELRAFLEGANGDGTGQYAGDATVPVAAFLNALKAQIGNYVYTIRKAHSIKGSQAWGSYSLWLPSELEVFGTPVYGDEGLYMPALTSPVLAARAAWITPVQFPIFQKSYAYRIKRYNNARAWWWNSPRLPPSRPALPV